MGDAEVNHLLAQLGLGDHIYQAMKNSDYSEVVMAASEVLKKIHSIPMIVKMSKSEEISTDHRNKGNVHYKHGEYRKALECYNLALKYAPNNSDAMKLAYSNRSAVLLAVDAFNACLKDIETCVDMNCSEDIIQKLAKRQKDCYTRGIKELSRDIMFLRDQFATKYFKFDVKRNAKVPCVSTDVDVVFDESGELRVVAANDIQVGTVVALEQAFVSTFSNENENLSCYHCHKMAFNLIPCEGCCSALFCSMDCKERCMKDYHRIECQIVDYIDRLYLNLVNKLATRAAIKFSLKCKSWQELISASLNIGASRMKNSTMNEIYDVKNKYSILNFTNDEQFIHGKMYKGSFVCASVLHCLSRVQNYFPQSSQEKEAAIRALARIMLQLYASFTNKIDVCCSAYDYRTDKILFNGQINYGWFSFTSKLKHACEPNLLVAGLNNKVALVALRPIERGEELNISYVMHWYNYLPHKVNNPQVNHRRSALFFATHLACRCRVCEEQWNRNSAKESYSLNEKQKKCYEELLSVNKRNYETAQPYFKAACRALGGLRGLENTKQHCEVFLLIRTQLDLFQFNETNNVTIT